MPLRSVHPGVLATIFRLTPSVTLLGFSQNIYVLYIYIIHIYRIYTCIIYNSVILLNNFDFAKISTYTCNQNLGQRQINCV